MSYTKPQIYNLALSALLLAKEVDNTETDTSNEVRVLNIHWNTAFESTLQDLDLDSLMTPITLELIEELDEGPWAYVYKYPTNCIFLRKIQSGIETDNAATHIAKVVRPHEGVKAIFTNEEDAVAECITNDISLAFLNPMAGMAVAYKLAMLSAPLIVGKGAKTLREEIKENYIIAKMEAQEVDRAENFNYEDEALRSEFVAARIE
jgi:hypothetical protein